MDSADGADVRTAMTVGGPGQDLTGSMAAVIGEESGSGEGYDVPSPGPAVSSMPT